jgi:hypothetical protein
MGTPQQENRPEGAVLVFCGSPAAHSGSRTLGCLGCLEVGFLAEAEGRVTKTGESLLLE